MLFELCALVMCCVLIGFLGEKKEQFKIEHESTYQADFSSLPVVLPNDIYVNGVLQLCDVKGCCHSACVVTNYKKRCYKHRLLGN